MMASPREDIASKLLHSSDARIAEAAKRVFSSNAALPPNPPPVVAGLALSPPSSSSTGAGVESDEGAMIRAAPSADEYDAMFPPSGGECHSGFEGFGRRGAAAVAKADHEQGGDADSVGSNDGDAEDVDGCDKKLSSTDRLKRR